MVDFENLDVMTNEELVALKSKIDGLLRERELQKLDNKVMLTLADEFVSVANIDGYRYNGGWTKQVTALNKARTNGYSLIGGFVNGTGRKNYYDKGSVFVDCDIQGSRRHPVRTYRLFYLDGDGKIELIQTEKSVDYAVNMWENIEKLLGDKEEA